MILFGPPGTGKTTIARIVAERTGADFEELSAVSARVDDVRAVIARARDRCRFPPASRWRISTIRPSSFRAKCESCSTPTAAW